MFAKDCRQIKKVKIWKVKYLFHDPIEISSSYNNSKRVYYSDLLWWWKYWAHTHSLIVSIVNTTAKGLGDINASCSSEDLDDIINRSYPGFNRKQRPRVTDVRLYLLSGEQCVDVFHGIEIRSVQGVLAGKNLQNRTQGERRRPEQLVIAL